MGAYALLLAVLLALLTGLALGKVWERYTPGGGKWIDGRRARESPHYIAGLNALAANRIELATRELAHAASLDPDAFDIHLILGNLYREQGQAAQAIAVHQTLLDRSSTLSGFERVHALLCLGLDYRRGGFFDRAREAFDGVLQIDPKNRHALASLENVQAEQRHWTEAFDTQQQLSKLAEEGEQAHNRTILAFLENEIGLEALRRKDYTEASRRFESAITHDHGAVPAYLNLGDVRAAQGHDEDAAQIWERLIDIAPDRAYLALGRLETFAARGGCPERFTRVCCRLIDGNPRDWRVRLALSQHLASRGAWRDGVDLLYAALVHNPHALVIHQAIWRALEQLRYPASLIGRYSDLTRHAVLDTDPHVCRRCHYRSGELLWHCPQCHDWNTFVEEGLARSDAA